jgi:hypothetical protein
MPWRAHPGVISGWKRSAPWSIAIRRSRSTPRRSHPRGVRDPTTVPARRSSWNVSTSSGSLLAAWLDS